MGDNPLNRGSVAALLAEAARSGARLELKGDEVALKGQSSLPPALVAQLRERRGEIRELLRNPKVLPWARELVARGLALDRPISLPVLGELKEVSAYATFLLGYLETNRKQARRDLQVKCLIDLWELRQALEGISPPADMPALALTEVADFNISQKVGGDRKPESGSSTEPSPNLTFPCVKAAGLCMLRTDLRASFRCVFGGKDCEFLFLPGIGRNLPDRECSVCGCRNWRRRQDGGIVCGVCHPQWEVKSGEWDRGGPVSSPTSHRPSPSWFLPDGRPVYREALVKRWESLGKPDLVLSRTVSVVDLPRWLAQDDKPLPSAMKWGIWRLNLADLAMVVDCLAEEAGLKASATREGKSTGFNSQQLSGQALSDKREEML